VTERQDARAVRILAHRGLAVDADENSIRAFRAAADVGTRWIETDVHTTSDGVVVAIHDPDIERVAGKPGDIATTEASDLAALRMVGGEAIPTMAAVFEACPDLCFNIDIKDEASVLALPRVIDRAEAWDRVLIASFSESRRRRAMRHAPDGVTSSAGYGGIAAFRLVSALMPVKACVRVWPVVRRALGPWIAAFQAMQVPMSHKVGPFRIPVADRRFIRAAHACGMRVDVWTVDDPRDMEHLVELGVDGIVTNRPDVALAVLDRLGTRPGGPHTDPAAVHWFQGEPFPPPPRSRNDPEHVDPLNPPRGPERSRAPRSLFASNPGL
jgi:glycerophosphoryl diester phosphodiesterase